MFDLLGDFSQILSSLLGLEKETEKIPIPDSGRITRRAEKLSSREFASLIDKLEEIKIACSKIVIKIRKIQEGAVEERMKLERNKNKLLR